jgi:hypothetical protein
MRTARANVSAVDANVPTLRTGDTLEMTNVASVVMRSLVNNLVFVRGNPTSRRIVSMLVSGNQTRQAVTLVARGKRAREVPVARDQ